MVTRYERELVTNILRKNERRFTSEEEYEQEANHLLMMNEEKIRSTFISCKASIA